MSQNTNELLYTIKYRKKFHFSFEWNNVLENHEIDFCCVFEIFHIQTSATESEIRINLSSAYPAGEDENIAFEHWKDHADHVVPERTEILKFNIMKAVLQDVSIFDSIRKIHSDLDTNPVLQTKFKQALRVVSLAYREVMQWPGELPWPEDVHE